MVPIGDIHLPGGDLPICFLQIRVNPADDAGGPNPIRAVLRVDPHLPGQAQQQKLHRAVSRGRLCLFLEAEPGQFGEGGQY
jgi:hypothetical protein